MQSTFSSSREKVHSQVEFHGARSLELEPAFLFECRFTEVLGVPEYQCKVINIGGDAFADLAIRGFAEPDLGFSPAGCKSLVAWAIGESLVLPFSTSPESANSLSLFDYGWGPSVTAVTMMGCKLWILPCERCIIGAGEWLRWIHVVGHVGGYL